MTGLAFSALGLAPALDLHLARIAAALVLCALAAFAAALLMRRYPGLVRLNNRLAGGVNRGVRVLEARRLSQHADICRFSCADKEYLVIVSAGHALVVRETDIAPAPADEPNR